MLEKIRLKLEKIPSEYRRWSVFGVLLALLLALPITIWGLTSGRFEIRKRAATAEITPTPSLMPSPTPTPVCKTGLNSFSVYNSCPEGFRNARYVCYDGFSGTLGDPTSCKTSDVWRRYAEEACKGHSSCPTPTPQLGCRQPCSSDNDCTTGLKCGTPCPSGQLCAQYLFCYNPNCPFDTDCICPTPTPIPTPTLACVPEGQTMPVYPGYQCCPGLAAISTAKPDQYGNCPSQPPLGASICAKCGNGICGLGENKCNCPGDCLAPIPTIAITPTPTPTPTPRLTPTPTPSRCPGICLPRMFCRLIGGTCYSGFRCTGWRGISPCCCLRVKK